ncbi:hypothetical protein [Bradyrhizobium sp. USDA 10063]
MGGFPIVGAKRNPMTTFRAGSLIGVTVIWQGPTTSRTPHARGALQDDNAHNWNASFPSARFDAAVVASVRKGYKLTRQLGWSLSGGSSELSRMASAASRCN